MPAKALCRRRPQPPSSPAALSSRTKWRESTPLAHSAPPVRFLFFFSSKRRHTRSLWDWSSDVCSSDLGPAGGRTQYYTPTRRGYRCRHCLCCHPGRTRQHQRDSHSPHRTGVSTLVEEEYMTDYVAEPDDAWLGLDLGTQSVRAMVVSTTGEVLGSGSHPLRSHR